VPRDTDRKAFAWLAPKKSPKNIVPGSQYIVYNPDWVQDVIGDDRYQAIALFGHEIAHLMLGHYTAEKDMAEIRKETQADQWAGCAVAKMGGDFKALENLFGRLRRKIDTSYPSRLKSLGAAKKGFENCGGVIPGSSTGKVDDEDEGEITAADESDDDGEEDKSSAQQIAGWVYYGSYDEQGWVKQNFLRKEKTDESSLPSRGEMIKARYPVNLRADMMSWDDDNGKWVNAQKTGTIPKDQELKVLERREAGEGFVWLRVVGELCECDE
jgi:hypothetical protein